MYFKMKYIAFLLVVTGLCLQSCSDGGNESHDKTARVKIKLVDFPGEYQEVNVNIIEVQYRIVPEDADPDTHETIEWTIFDSFTPTEELIDLTDLTGGVSLILADEVLEAGYLSQIRLVLGDGNEIVTDEGTFPLETPSAQQSGLKIQINTLLQAGYSYNIVLDWDVQKSVVNTGNGKYILKPVIRAELEANSGIIEGIVKKEIITKTLIDGTTDQYETVTTYETLVSQEVYLYTFSTLDSDITFDNDFYTSTETNENGMCRFEGIKPGSYKIVIGNSDDSEPTIIFIYESDEITVTEGVIYSGDEHGEIILKLVK